MNSSEKSLFGDAENLLMEGLQNQDVRYGLDFVAVMAVGCVGYAAKKSGLLDPLADYLLTKEGFLPKLSELLHSLDGEKTRVKPGTYRLVFPRADSDDPNLRR